MILFSLLIEKLNSWRSWRLGGSLFISIFTTLGATTEEIFPRIDTNSLKNFLKFACKDGDRSVSLFY